MERTDTSVVKRAARAWPALAAIVVFVLVWQIVVWSHWKPSEILPGPVPTLRRVWHDLASGQTISALRTTMSRAAFGYGAAVALGTAIALAVGLRPGARAAFGSLITGLQTMPSVAWFPLALILFGPRETAIFFVVVLGAAPAIANGLLGGIDHTPPILLRAGRVMGARGIASLRHVVLPAALPSYVSGLKQGWAFAWRSLMAGELLVIIEHRPSIGSILYFNGETFDQVGVVASMVVIFVIGVVIDAVFFARLERYVRVTRGLETG